MKKKLMKKLTLNKKTITNLNISKMNHIKGGASGIETCDTCPLGTCRETCPCGPERSLESDCYCMTREFCYTRGCDETMDLFYC